MKRTPVTIDQVRAYARENGIEDADNLGIMALVEVENMGFCSDGVTRYYMFDMDNKPCIYFKH